MPARRKIQPPPLPQVETRDPRELVHMLLNGLSLSRVPKDLHVPLLVQLSAAKQENLVAGRIENARKLQSLMRQLDVSVIRPEPVHPLGGRRPATAGPERTSRLSLISSLRESPASIEAKVSKTQLELTACQDYWNTEIGRYDEMKQDAFDALAARLKRQLAEVDAEPRKVPKPRATSALVELQEKHRTLPRTYQNEDAREDLEGRISYISYLSVKNQQSKIDEGIQARKARIREDYERDRVELQRRWDAKWQRLVTERREDIAKKERQLRMYALSTPLSTSLPAGRLPTMQ